MIKVKRDTITVKRFTFTKAQWNGIKTVVRDALGRDADRVVLESERMDGTRHGVTLRKEIAATARLHITRDKAMRSLPSQMKFREDLTGKRKDAVRLRDWIVGPGAFWCSHNGYAPDNDMLVATDAYFEKLLHNLDGIIDGLGPPRKKTGSAASKKISRDLFWSDLLAIWRQIGGKPPHGVADFLIAVSAPVIPRGARDDDRYRKAVVQWLRRHRQA